MVFFSVVMRVLTHLNVGATLALVAWVATYDLPAVDHAGRERLSDVYETQPMSGTNKIERKEAR